MSTFLTTTAISYELEKLISDSERYLLILSPYLKMVPRLQVLIGERLVANCDVRIVYGKDELTKDERTWISKFPNLGLYYCENLHAKCFINEKSAIISSMNLYEYSQVKNYEMGVLLVAKDDSNMFNPLFNEVARIFGASQIKSSGYREPFPLANYCTVNTMGDVYAYIVNNYTFPYNPILDHLYKEVSAYALTISKFSIGDFYQDRSALLRTTPISQENFDKIVMHFSRIGKRKSK